MKHLTYVRLNGAIADDKFEDGVAYVLDHGNAYAAATLPFLNRMIGLDVNREFKIHSVATAQRDNVWQLQAADLITWELQLARRTGTGGLVLRELWRNVPHVHIEIADEACAAFALILNELYANSEAFGSIITGLASEFYIGTSTWTPFDF